MLYHRFDAETKIYLDTIEAEEQPENSVSGALPDITEHYTVAFIDNQWMSVLKPDFEIIDNKIELKQQQEQ
jgi:hypothetical protein